jgi:hypothetical protein
MESISQLKLRHFFAWFNLDRILALVAILAGLIAVLYETELRHEFQVQKDAIREVVSSVTTRYVAQFPNDLDNVRELMAEAKKGDEVSIFIDFVGYGHYSAPDKYQKYIDSITDARKNGARVKILIYGDDLAWDDMMSQFDQSAYRCLTQAVVDPQDKCEEGDLATRRKQLVGYFEVYRPVLGKCGIRASLSRHEDFFWMLRCTNEHFCDQLLSQNPDIEIRTIKPTPISEKGVSTNETMFFWMIRDEMVKEKPTHNRKMILNFPNFSNVGSGPSFHSSDERLMEIFRLQFDKKWDEANPILTECYPEKFWRAKIADVRLSEGSKK